MVSSAAPARHAFVLELNGALRFPGVPGHSQGRSQDFTFGRRALTGCPLRTAQRGS